MSNTRPSANVFQLLERRARQQPDAVLCYHGTTAVSNRQAHDDALTLAAGLRRRLAPRGAGPTTPTVLAAMLRDPYALHRVLWASQAAGYCLVFLPVVHDVQQVKALMAQVEARHLCTDVPSVVEEGFAFSVADLGYTSKLVPSYDNAAGPAFLLRTSGTTGSGKWVTVQHRQIMIMLETMQETGALRHAENQVAFLTPPLSHSYGLSTLLEYVHAGSAVAFPQGTSPLGPAGELGEGELAERITAIEGVANFYSQLARLLRRVRLPALRHVGFGGGRLDDEALSRLHQVYPELTCSVRYGLTETPSIVSGMVFRLAEKDDWSGSGKVLPVWEVRIVDPAGQPLPDGQEGEIELRGPCLAWPYHGEDEVEGAFFATGDTGTLRDGHLSIRGRKSLFIKHGGYRFSPEEVEAVVRLFDGVLDVRVLMDDGVLTAELVVADHEPDLQALRTFLGERLPSYAAPKNLVRVAHIPRTASGKIKRHPGSQKTST